MGRASGTGLSTSPNLPLEDPGGEVEEDEGAEKGEPGGIEEGDGGKTDQAEVEAAAGDVQPPEPGLTGGQREECEEPARQGQCRGVPFGLLDQQQSAEQFDPGKDDRGGLG